MTEITCTVWEHDGLKIVYDHELPGALYDAKGELIYNWTPGNDDLSEARKHAKGFMIAHSKVTA